MTDLYPIPHFYPAIHDLKVLLLAWYWSGGNYDNWLFTAGGKLSAFSFEIITDLHLFFLHHFKQHCTVIKLIREGGTKLSFMACFALCLICLTDVLFYKTWWTFPHFEGFYEFWSYSKELIHAFKMFFSLTLLKYIQNLSKSSIRLQSVKAIKKVLSSPSTIVHCFFYTNIWDPFVNQI